MLVWDFISQVCEMGGKKESAEFRREEMNDAAGWWWRKEDGIDSMDDAIGCEDIAGDNMAVEIDAKTTRTKCDTDSLIPTKFSSV